MSTMYIGEIRMFGGTFAPLGWMSCEGQVLPIAQYSALFNLIGTTYGGDGSQTFSLPDLRGRIPLHQGQGPGRTARVLGEVSGSETVTLAAGHIPQHNHALVAVSASPGHIAEPSGAYVAADRDFAAFDTQPASISMASDTVTQAGGSQPHDNMPPYACVTFIIAVEGIYPTQN
jgi:microcystin-dependent protein